MPASRLLIALSGVAFISLGLPDGLLGVAWPSMRAFFARELDALGILLVAATAGYISSSFSSGRLLRHVNLGMVLAASTLLTAAALMGYAASPAWLLMIPLAAVLGLGGGAVDSALNTYAATNHGPQALNWLHACYGIGAAIGPLIMTAVLARALPWQRGYAIVGAGQLVLAVCFLATLRFWPRTIGAAHETAPHSDIGATLRLPGAQLGILAFFVYAGVEGGIGAWTYTLLTESRGVPVALAGSVVSVFWGALTGGRLLAAFGGHRLSAARLIQISIAGVLAGTIMIWLDAHALVTGAGVLLAGCACGPIFPTLVATTPSRLGAEHAPNAVGFQIAAAALGLALLPGAIGVAADAFRIELIATLFVVLALLLVVVVRQLETTQPRLKA